MFDLIMHSTHFIYGYMVSENDKGPLRQCERKPTATTTLYGLLFLVSSKGSFISTIPKTG